MGRFNLRMAAGLVVAAVALLAAGLPAQSTPGVSPDEARQVTGGQTGGPCFVGATGGFGCDFGGGLCAKFWEGCTSTPWWGVNTAYSCNDMINVSTCTTTCGYNCGTYNGYVACSTYVPGGGS